MELTQFLILLCLAFLLSYFGLSAFVHSTRKVQPAKEIDLTFPLGIALIFPVLLLSPFIGIGTFNFNENIYFIGLASFALLILFLLKYPFEQKSSWAVLGLVSFVATYLLPSDMPLFQHTFILNVLSRILMTIGLLGFMYLFLWLDRVPFLSMTTSLAFTVLTVLFATAFNALPLQFAIFALLILTTQIGASLYLKQFIPFYLGKYAAFAVAFLWGNIGFYLVAKGYTYAPVFASTYYLVELAFVFVMTLVFKHSVGLSEPFLIERAMQTNFRLPRIFRFIFLCTIGWGLLGFWNSRISYFGFIVITFFLVFYLVYRFLNWANQPTYKSVLKELKQGCSDLKTEIDNLKKTRSEMKQKRNVKQLTQKATKPVKKTQTVQKKSAPKTKGTKKPAKRKTKK